MFKKRIPVRRNEDNRAEDFFLEISPQKFAPGSSGRQKKELRIY